MLRELNVQPSPDYSGSLSNKLSLWDYAEHYLYELNISVLPIAHSEKHPTGYRYASLLNKQLYAIKNPKNKELLQRFYELSDYQGLAAIAGPASDNLFSLDCETRESLFIALDALKARGIIPPYFISSDGGHILLKARGKQPVKAVPLKIMGNIEVRGSSKNKITGETVGQLIVLPPTIHETGVQRLWQDNFLPEDIPIVDIDDINFLVDTSGKPVELEYVSGGRCTIHKDTINYLQHGHNYPEGIRNDALYNATRDYRNNDYGEDATLKDFLIIAINSGLSEKEARATIASVFKNNRHIEKSKKQNDTLQQKLVRYVASIKWTGKTGSTDYAVLQALLEHRRYDAQNSQKSAFRATYREIKAKARIAENKTVKHSLDRLIKRGIIEHAGNNIRGSSLWLFTDKCINDAKMYANDTSRTTSDSAVTGVFNIHFFDKALSETKAIGKRAYQVYKLIQSTDGIKTTELAEITGVLPATVRTHLRKLRAHNLINRIGGIYRAIGTPTQIIKITTEARTQERERDRRIAEERAMYALNPILEYLWNKFDKARTAMQNTPVNPEIQSTAPNTSKPSDTAKNGYFEALQRINGNEGFEADEQPEEDLLLAELFLLGGVLRE